MDGEIAVAGVPTPAPGVERDSDAANQTRLVLPAGMPLLIPVHQLRGDGKLFAINVLPRLGKVEILAEEFDRVHVQLGGEIVQRADGKKRSLRMVGCAPGACGSDIVADGSVFLSLVRNDEDVRNGRHAATAGTTCPPGFRLPGDDGAVLSCADFHAGVSRRPSSGNFQLHVSLKHDADWLTIRLPGDLGGKNSPTIGRKLAAKTPTHVILLNSDVGGGHFQ